MDGVTESEIRERIRSILIDEKTVEQELSQTYVWSLIRKAYGDGYLAALEEPEAERPTLEQAATLVARSYLRLPVG